MSNVDHPKHYGGEENTYEAIKVIEAWGVDFCLGNTLKYISRAGRKGNTLEDLEKAKWYLQRRIDKERAKAQPKEAPTASLPDVGFSYRPDEHKVVINSTTGRMELVSKTAPGESLAEAPQCPCACCQGAGE